ncbi:hypothetical protein OAK51_03715 [Alphaproteobacteria bacterium]|nr:hypothetical protein [Alphaproteobacteria bacterium]
MDISIREIEPKFDYHQLLLSWFSPNFPIGSYNFSHGLEAAIDMNLVNDIVSLENWITYLISYGSGRNDSILLSNTYQGKKINDLAFALCTSKERWLETKQLGNAFCKNINENWSFNIGNNLAYPIAVGKAGDFFKIPLEQLLITFIQSFVSNLLNMGIKHIPLGHSDGQKILIKLLPTIKKLALNYKDYDIDDVGTSAFISDLTSMYHETLKNRIYQT